MTSSDPDERSMLPTRVPPALRAYLKAYAKLHGLSMEAFLAEVLEHFITLRPDQRGLRWRKPHSNRGQAGDQEGWAQLNLWMSNDLAARIVRVTHETAQTRAVLLYTALFWFARFLRPPAALLAIGHVTESTTQMRSSTTPMDQVQREVHSNE